MDPSCREQVLADSVVFTKPWACLVMALTMQSRRGGSSRARGCSSAYLAWYGILRTCVDHLFAQLKQLYVRDPPCACSTLFQHLTMAEKEVSSTLKQIHQTLHSRDYQQSLSLLTRAKLALLSLNGLVPSPNTPQSTLLLARETFELGALVSIRRQDYESFTRYFEQLQPFYDLSPSQLSPHNSNQSKITGLHLLLLLSQGDYAGFHTVLESLEVAAAASGDGKKAPKGGKAVEDDVYIQYPVKLEQDLMEGAYDKVWGATKSERVPSEEYGVFSEVSLARARPLLQRGLSLTDLTYRYSSVPYDRKSQPARRKHTLHSLYPTPRACCSSRVRAA